MSSRYDLQAPFQADGVFWPATDPSRVFSAHLIAGKKRIEISRAAEIGGPEQFLANDDPGTSVLHGSTTLGPCTLIDLQSLSAPKYLDGLTGQVLLAPRFRVSACVLGIHLVDENAPIITSGTFSYAGLGDWLRTSTQIRLTDEAVLISHPIPTPSLLDFFVGATKTRIVLRVASRLHFSPSGRHSASRDEPQVSIHPAEPVSLVWLIDTAKRFENFLSLCLGTSARLRAVQLRIGESEEGWLVERLLGKVEKPDLQSWIQCTTPQLAQSIEAWLSLPEEFRPLENLIYGTIRNSSMFVETEFLSLAQGLESLHRLTDSGAPTDKVTFKSRIESLIARVSPDRARTLLGDPQLFEQSLRKTRNFFTHPGIPKTTGVLTTFRRKIARFE